MSGSRYNSGMPWANPEPPRDPLVQKGLTLLGAAMRRARLRKGWSQRDLEARTGVDQSTISRFERGDRVGMRFSRLCLIVGALDGLEFDPPGPAVEPFFSTRKAWIEYEERQYRATLARLRAEEFELDDDDEPDPDDDPKPPP